MDPIDTPISPELVLVDPELARALRSLPPEPDTAFPAHPVAPSIGKALGPPMGVVTVRAAIRHERVQTPPVAAPPVVVPTMPAARPTERRRTPTYVLTLLATSVALNGALVWDMISAPATSALDPSPAFTDSAYAGVAPAGEQGDPSGSSPDTTAARPAEPPASSSECACVRLRWRPVAGALFYDVVLWYEGRRALDVWPVTAATEIPDSWEHAGVRYRIGQGRFTWHVFPAFERGGGHRYGTRIASGSIERDGRVTTVARAG